MLVLGSAPGDQATAQDTRKPGESAGRVPAGVSREKAEPPSTGDRKLEAFVLLPEPREMRTERSRLLPNAKSTVISAARETAGLEGVQTYSKEEFEKLGISLDTFIERARAAADRRLAALQPDFVRDESGKIRYAVFRGDSPLMASLLMAPSLGRIFKNIFGDEVWAVVPDRHALYIFPPGENALSEFSGDLRERYESNPFASSGEIFSLKANESMPQVVGSFAD